MANNTSESDCIRDNLIDCLTIQLSELELFQSMYPDTDEVCLTDSTVVNDMCSFINKATEFTPTHLDFVLNLIVNKMKLEICINLPSLYPNDVPDVCIRCNQLNRQQESKLNDDLVHYIKEISHKGEDMCLYTIVSWIQDKVNSLDIDAKVKDLHVPDVKQPKLSGKFARFWIHCHHIYSKKKRDDIAARAKDLNLNGFCLPGKPGIVCIEGDESNCKEWWRLIKSMCWKKIAIRKMELYDAKERRKKQKFDRFEEIHFQNSRNRNPKHMDMSSFSKYMEQLGLSETFNDFFGLCNDDT